MSGGTNRRRRRDSDQRIKIFDSQAKTHVELAERHADMLPKNFPPNPQENQVHIAENGRRYMWDRVNGWQESANLWFLQPKK
jgi:hypothetical protein